MVIMLTPLRDETLPALPILAGVFPLFLFQGLVGDR